MAAKKFKDNFKNKFDNFDKERVMDDMARFAGTAAHAIGTVSKQIKSEVKARVEEFGSRMDFVPREDFEKLEAMLVAARLEQEALIRRVDALEGKKPSSTAKKKSSAKKAETKPKTKTSVKPKVTKDRVKKAATKTAAPNKVAKAKTTKAASKANTKAKVTTNKPKTSTTRKTKKS